MLYLCTSINVVKMLKIHCYQCSDLIPDLKLFFSHLKNIHNITSNFLCGFGCETITMTKSGMRRHMLTCDFGLNNVNTSAQNIDSEVKSSNEVFFKNECINDLKKKVHCLASELGGRNIPYTTINLIISNIRSILECIFLYIRANFIQSDKDCMKMYIDFLEFQNSILRIIDNLKTTYKRRKFVYETVPKPKEITLGSRAERKWDKELQMYMSVPVANT